jgi:hypothetical protein
MPPAATEAITGSMSVTEADLVTVIVEGSGIFRVRWTCGALLAGGLLPYVATAPGHVPMSGTSVATYFVVAFGYLFLMPRVHGRRSFSGVVAAGDKGVSYHLDDEGLTVRGAGTTSTMAYRVFSQVREAKTAFFVGTGDNPAAISIFKKAFSSDDVKRLRALLATHLKVDRGLSKASIIALLAFGMLPLVFLWQCLMTPR